MKSRSLIQGLCLAATFAMTTGLVQAGPAKAGKQAAAKSAEKSPGKAPEAFDNWRLNCQMPQAGGTEVCELIQLAIVMNNQGQQDTAPEGEARGQLLLTVAVLKPAGVDAPRMVMRAPLGVFLQPSPVIRVPGHADVQVPFLRCDNTGCFSVPLSLAKEFLDAARATDAAVSKDDKATDGTVTIAFQVNQPGQAGQMTNVTLPLSMKGFSAGLAALEARANPVAVKDKKDDKGKAKKR